MQQMLIEICFEKSIKNFPPDPIDNYKICIVANISAVILLLMNEVEILIAKTCVIILFLFCPYLCFERFD